MIMFKRLFFYIKLYILPKICIKCIVLLDSFKLHTLLFSFSCHLVFFISFNLILFNLI